MGGIAGTLARFAVASWAAAAGWVGFPWATLLVNLAGSVLLGFLVAALPAWNAPIELRALLTVGFCGSFTTFSTFGYETALLLLGGMPAQALLYVGASVILGLIGVFLGLAVGGLVG